MMETLFPCLILMSLFLASDVASQLVDHSTPLATALPPEHLLSSETDSALVAAEATRGDGVVDERTSMDRTHEAAETTIPNRTFKSTSVQSVSKVHMGWPTASASTNFTAGDAIKTYVVGSNPAEGDTITLSCVVLDPTILTVSWYRIERLSTHDILAPAADVQRMSILLDSSDDARRVFNLTIEYLHSEDSGEYTCRGINRPVAVATLDITVRYIPELHYPECYLNGKRQAIVMEGDTLKFECRSEKGIPPWHLIWFRQLNKSIDVITTSIEDRSEMIFSEHSVIATRELTGATYMCSLVCLSHECLKANNNGPRNCNIGPLIVNERPQPTTPEIITIDPGMPIASEGDDIEFDCSTTLENGNAVWFPVGGDPPPDDHIIISDGGSHMSIRNVQVNDTDLMACGVFCQEKLVTVRHANFEILRKPTSTSEPTTTKTATSSSTTASLAAVLTVTDRLGNDAGDRDRRKNEEIQAQRRVKIGTPLTLIFMLVILIVLLVIVVRLRRHSYQRAATEPPDLGYTV
ncbi:cell adhesion molecule 1-like [Lytechinus variegatus]|uniref:cell adhesion molecule 1-like n=1 Tax=Lytechinus variegatus TaxID=7654 RepID=UPI001BB153CF|nr:cell adhesion molecule 1-like [Lytechinus variegatus]XP_041454092.1 cell adhesion molecule 1-like [Lytechinus variegatus]XP_041454093.1 cell adhesion molecule 1-like [Lytechinus variegatus]XP_041454094.1 cell adhesion molecule 1-like [Lytechinus variegatus]